MSYCFFIASFLSVFIDKMLREDIGYLGLFAVFVGFLLVALVVLAFFEEKCVFKEDELRKPLVQDEI